MGLHKEKLATLYRASNGEETHKVLKGRFAYRACWALERLGPPASRHQLPKLEALAEARFSVNLANGTFENLSHDDIVRPGFPVRKLTRHYLANHRRK